jgi:hypothetical protein
MKRTPCLLPLLFALASLTTSGSAHAQREIGLGIGYDPRLPMGGLRDLVPKAGIAGVQGKWEYYVIDRHLALGFDLQYHYFQQTAQVTTVPIDNGAATAPFTRYAYFVSVLPSIRYFPWASQLRIVRPYVEVGVGATSATGAVQASDLVRRENGGGVIFQPSAGVMWAIVSHEEDEGALRGSGESSSATRRPKESMFGLVASAAWALTTADVLTAKNVSTAGVQLGVYSKM